MAQEAADIEVSKDSIKLSYRRYLSDSSAGFILLLSLIWIFFREFKDIAKALPSEVLLFAGLMLFLLATPVGMLINVLSLWKPTRVLVLLVLYSIRRMVG